MSHLIKIDSKEPNRNGSVFLDLTDFSNVSSTAPSDGATLKYSGSSWDPIQENSETLSGVFQATNSWFNYAAGSGANYTPDGVAANRPPKDIMQVAYTVSTYNGLLDNGIGQYNWGMYETWYTSSYPRFSGFYVPPGTYYCKAAFGGYATSGSSSELTAQWFLGPAQGTAPTVANMVQAETPKAKIKAMQGTQLGLVSGIIDTTANSTLLGVQVLASTGYNYALVSNWVKSVSVYITKLA